MRPVQQPRQATDVAWPESNVPAGIDRLTERLFARLARWRDARPFHPRGVCFEGTIRSTESSASPTFVGDGPRRVLVRLSKAAGLPPRVPDVLGLALRVEHVYGQERHQDLLLVTSGRWPGVRHLLVPARGYDRRGFSSLLAYRYDERLVLVGARYAGPRRAQPLRLADLNDDNANGLRFVLLLAGLTGTWTPVARVVLERRLSDEASMRLRFDPWNAAPSFRPVGPLNHLRAAAYRASRCSATSP
jgi:hypothetical protein